MTRRRAPARSWSWTARTASAPPDGGGDLDFRWEVESAPERALAELRTSIAGSYDEDAYNGPYIAYFDMPQLYAGESLVFKLTTTIWGQTDSDTVRITSNNPLPVANAGPDQEQAPGERVVLQGSGSLDPQVQQPQVEYAWVQMSEATVTLSDATAANPWFILPQDAPAGRALQFQLTVTDRQGESDSDTVTVTVREPVRPTASAGPDLTGAPGESVTLQGKGSSNPYGRWHQMAHQWTQLSGPSVTLDKPTHGDPTFTVPANAQDGATLEFELTVTDKEGQSDSDTMIVTVAAPETVVVPETVLPTANAGPDLTGAPGDGVTLQGKGSVNPYGRWHEMAYQWTQLSGPAVTLTHPRTTQPAGKFADPSFTIPADAAGGATLEFRLTVTDQEGQSDSDTMTVTVTGAEPEPVRPTATAGPDLTGAPGESVTLQGKGSVNPYGRWHQMAHQWTQLSGPTVTLTHPRTTQPAGKFADPSFTIPADAAGGTTLEFQLTVTDKEGQSDSDTVTVTVAAPPPFIVEPTDKAVRLREDPGAEAAKAAPCVTDLGELTAAVEFTGAWDDPECRAHHRADSPARYVHFTVSEETEVSITLTPASALTPESGGALFVSKDTPQNGWGTPPGATYEDRRSIRRGNGKLLHDGAHTVTLTLAAGETYTVEAASTSGDGGSFTLSIAPQ